MIQVLQRPRPYTTKNVRVSDMQPLRVILLLAFAVGSFGVLEDRASGRTRLTPRASASPPPQGSIPRRGRRTARVTPAHRRPQTTSPPSTLGVSSERKQTTTAQMPTATHPTGNATIRATLLPNLSARSASLRPCVEKGKRDCSSHNAPASVAMSSIPVLEYVIASIAQSATPAIRPAH